jgi:hypothetical protein
MGASAYGLTVTGPSPMGDTVTFEFGAFQATASDACPAQDAPSGVMSLSIKGSEMGNFFGAITLCVPRPDELATQALPLGTGVQVIDFSASDANCNYTIDTTMPLTGTARGEHECDDGTSKAGFALEITGSATLNQLCFTDMDLVPVTLTGTTAIGG